jgi:hypothetical protein
MPGVDPAVPARSPAGVLRGRSVLVLADQVVSSGSNALAIIVAALVLTAADLNVYALLQLIATTLIAFQRAFISEPSLALTSEQERADLSGRWVILALLPASIVGFGIGVVVFGSVLGGAALASIVLPCIQDLLRYRSFGLKRVGRALWSDSIWLVLFVMLVPTLSDPESLQLFIAWSVPSGLAALAVLSRGDGRPRVRPGDVVALGKFQIAEWAIGSVTSSMPLFVAQALVTVSSVGAFRLAQTLTGPLNTISSFISVRFLMGAAELRSMNTAESIAYVRHVGRLLVAVAVAYSAIALVGFFVLAGMVDESVRGPLAYALPLTLLSSVVTAPAAAYVAYVKAVGEQRLTIRPRTVTLVANVLAIALGVGMFIVWGVDPIIAPVVLTSVVLVLAWRRTFRRASRRVRPGRADVASIESVDGHVIDIPTTPDRRPADGSALRDPRT